MALSKQVILVGEKELPRGNKVQHSATFLDDNGDPVSGVDTGADVVLTGYVTGSAGALAATDTVNEAMAKLEARIVALETP